MYDFIMFVMGLFQNILEAAAPVVQFFSRSISIPEITIPFWDLTIPAVSYTIGEWFFGAGLGLFLFFALAKWVIEFIP